VKDYEVIQYENGQGGHAGRYARVACYDNGGETIDRYTVVYLDLKEGPGLFSSVGMNESPFHPQGFGQHFSVRPGRHLGKRIPFAFTAR
jgi:hypothetical protein